MVQRDNPYSPSPSVKSNTYVDSPLVGRSANGLPFFDEHVSMSLCSGISLVPTLVSPFCCFKTRISPHHILFLGSLLFPIGEGVVHILEIAFRPQPIGSGRGSWAELSVQTLPCPRTSLNIGPHTKLAEDARHFNWTIASLLRFRDTSLILGHSNLCHRWLVSSVPGCMTRSL